jgi:hypothetical protein
VCAAGTAPGANVVSQLTAGRKFARIPSLPMSDADRYPDEGVEEAAEHASRAVEHRQEMQRRAVQAEAAEGDEEARLEQQAEEHRRAAGSEEAQADDASRQADGSADA